MPDNSLSPPGQSRGEIRSDICCTRIFFWAACLTPMWMTGRRNIWKTVRVSWTDTKKPHRINGNTCFETQGAINRLLAGKCMLGVEIRKAYREGKRETLFPALNGYWPCQLLETVISDVQEQWCRENKIFGLDILQQQLGGLKQRMLFACDRLEGYTEGRMRHPGGAGRGTAPLLRKRKRKGKRWYPLPGTRYCIGGKPLMTGKGSRGYDETGSAL